jgi:hypothetical protein
MSTTESQTTTDLEALPEAQRAELAEWLIAKKASDAAAVKRCRKIWNLTVTPEQMKEFRARARASWNQARNQEWVESGAATARVFQKLITDHPVEFMDLLFRATGQASFNKVLEGGDLDAIKQAHEHLRLLLSRRKDDRDEKRYVITREKWEFNASEACLKQLPELKIISDESQLSFKEKIRQIRLKLFGSAS